MPHQLLARLALIRATTTVVFLLVANSARAQFVDPSVCFNPILQQHLTKGSSEEMKLSTISQINENTFDSAKHDASLSATYDFIGGSASYSDFSTKRRQYFESHGLSLEHYQSLSISQTVLGDQAYGVITSCIHDLALSNYGLHYTIAIQDETDAAVTFYWNRGNSGPSELKLVDSTLDHAKVVSGSKVPQGKLFETGIMAKTVTISAGAAKTFLLTRDGGEKHIRLALETEPGTNLDAIDIPPVPPKDLPKSQVAWSSPCVESRNGFCYACEFAVQLSDLGASAASPFVCQHMPPGEKVVATYRGGWVAALHDNTSRWIDIVLEQTNMGSVGTCSGQLDAFCFGRVLDTNQPISRAVNYGAIDDKGNSAWQLRVGHCQSTGNAGDHCSTSGLSTLKVSVFYAHGDNVN
jgi:hypothetical protein